MQRFFSGKLILIWALSLAVVCQAEICRADHDLAREQLPKSWKDDAELTDVFFLNANLGWAVGAQGVILRTTNGGQKWHEISNVAQNMPHEMPLDQKIRNLKSGIRTRSTGITNGRSEHQPVRCRFETVHFIDEKYGWIGGGYEVPYVGRSRAVVMRTKDGGISWESVEGLVIPRINRMQFSDPIHGWAIGETGNLFQTGIFSTSDGGQTWSSQSAEKMEGWIDGERTSTGFISIDYSGRPGVVQPDRYEAGVMLGGEAAPLHRLAMADPTHGWAVGQRGTLLATTNGGMSWSPATKMADWIRQFDFQTLSVTNAKVWFAGSPGSQLFSLDRQSGEVVASRTPINTRINQICFIDDTHGWAVGALGAIIATQDGGQTWHLQRGDNRRIAILGIAPRVDSLPLEIFSKYATEENRICASLTLNGSSPELQTAVQATERLGSAVSVPFNSQPGQPLNRAVALEKMVRVLRTWQPNVIVCNSGHIATTTNGNQTLDPISLLEDAIRMAADPSVFPAQIADAGLKAWRVERLAFLDPAGTVGIDPQRLLPRSGILIEDQISVSRVLIGQSILVEHGPSYQVAHYTNTNRMNAGDLVSGLGSATNVPTRQDSDSKRGNLVMIQQATAKQKKFQQFVQFEANNPQDVVVWRQQIESFAMTMESDVAGVWLMQLAERYLQKGKTELAAQAIQSVVTRWPDHAFSPAALTWLSQYYASDEFGQIEFMNRIRIGQFNRQGQMSKAQRIQTQFQSSPQSVQQGGGSHLVWVPTQRLAAPAESNNQSNFDLAGHEESVAPSRPPFFDERLKLASLFLSQLGQRDPELVAGPQYQFLESQISRRINGTIMSEGRLRNLAQRRTEPSMVDVSVGARRELAIHDLLPNETRPIASMICQPTQSRPRLDGQLDEPFWQSAIENGNCVVSEVSIPCLQSNANTDISVFAYDDEFLYVGFRCQKVKGHFYNSRKTARPRDANLERRDRVEFSFDLDRDYRSANKFVVDHRGWVRESCGGSIGWDPDWYVSQSEDETTWTVEIAIPLEQITPGPIEPEALWGFQIARRAFDLNNLWDPQTHSEMQAPPQRSGLQSGFESRPAEFQLIRFQPQAMPK